MTAYERAIQTWQVLIGAAHHRQTITGERLGELIGVRSDDLAPPLSQLTRWCARNGWPPITSLVLGTATGGSDEGLASGRGSDHDRERVFQHSWFKMPPLTVGELEAAERPARRPCPKCGRDGHAAASLCGYCWVKLTPLAAP
jgi:hypothetical protein